MKAPPLKWVGGKSSVLSHVLSALGRVAGRYIEPFIGAGVVYLNVQCAGDRCVIGDKNEKLVELYRSLRDHGEVFIEEAASLFVPENHDKAKYLTLRDEYNDPSTTPRRRAALLLYLNKHCFNGLYRENGQGGHNVAFGAYPSPPTFPRAALLALSLRLRGTLIMTGDFEALVDDAVAGDVVYCDPPYVKAFTSYTGAGFSWADQTRLASAAMRAAARGARVVVSNHVEPEITKVYESAELRYVHARRNVSCDASTRGKARELLAVFA